MFDDFYGLTGRPFQLTPDPAFYFQSITHRKALSYLGYGLAQGEGFMVITGEVGAGKSTLVAHLVATIDPDQLTIGQVVTTSMASLMPWSSARLIESIPSSASMSRLRSSILTG